MHELAHWIWKDDGVKKYVQNNWLAWIMVEEQSRNPKMRARIPLETTNFSLCSRQRIFRCSLQCHINMNLVFHILHSWAKLYSNLIAPTTRKLNTRTPPKLYICWTGLTIEIFCRVCKYKTKSWTTVETWKPLT